MLSLQHVSKSLTTSAIAASLVFAAYPAASKVEDDTIMLGSAISLTGKYSAYGIHTRNGYELAIKRINEIGGVEVDGKSYKLDIVYYDDESTPARTAQLLERMIVQDSIQYILGPYGSATTIAAAAVTEKYKVPMVYAEGASRALLNKGYEYSFGVLSTAEQYLTGAINLAAEIATRNGKDPADVRIAMAFENDPFSLEVRAGVVDDAAKYGMQIVLDDALPKDLTDISAALAKVRALKPDLLLVSGHIEAAAMTAKQLGEMRIDTPMVAVTHCEAAQLTTRFPEFAEGFICPTQWDESLNYRDSYFGSALEYSNFFREIYKDYPSVPFQAAQASAAVLVWKDAFERSGGFDNDAIRDAIAETNLETFYGPIKFSEAGNNVAKPMVLRQIQNGTYNVVAPTKWASHSLQYPRLGTFADDDRNLVAESPTRPLAGIDSDVHLPEPTGFEPSWVPLQDLHSDSSETVYNLVFEPMKQQEPLVIYGDRPTRMALSIGPPQPQSVLPLREIDDRIRMLAAEYKAPVTVRMVCGICEENATQSQVIEFDPRLNESTHARFTIHASRDLAERSGGLGQIDFTLTMRGYELNHIELDVFVDEINADVMAEYEPPHIDFLPLPDEPGVPPDLVMSVTPEGVSGEVAIIFEPILPALHEMLRELVYDDVRGTWRKFTILGPSSGSELQRIARDSYERLRQMVEPDKQVKERLKQIYEAQGVTTFDMSFPSNPVTLMPQHRDIALLTFKEVGQDLYGTLFSDLFGEKGVREILQLVEAFVVDSGRPLRISVQTPYFLPWQILYPNFADQEDPDIVDPDKFWGFKYELSVRQFVKNQNGRLESSVLRPSRDEVLFAKGRAAFSEDQIEMLADELADLLYARYATPASLPIVDSSQAFIESLERNAKTLQFVFLFTHGTSGSRLLWDSNMPITVADDVGPQIRFSKDEVVTPRDIQRIYNQIGPPLPIWPRAPIFVLNACETGTGGAEPANAGLFVSTLIRLGARAVIATESEVWTQFGAEWGRKLIEEVRDGNDLPRAVLNTRRHHLNKNQNPMGLLYSLYGNHNARVEFPPGP